MNVTLLTLRGLLSQEIGDNLTGVCTSDGAASGATFIDSELSGQFASDDAVGGYWAKVTSGTAINQTRLIKPIGGYANATGTVTPQVAFSSGTTKILTGTTYEIHRVKPSVKDQYINRALAAAYPSFFQTYDDRSLVTSGFLPNDDFDEWSQTTHPDYWDVRAAASCTITEENTAQRYGAACAKVITAGTATGYALRLTEDEWSPLLDLADQPVSYEKWAKTASSACARLELYSADAAGSTLTYTGTYHTGGGQWEKLTLPTDAKVIANAVNVHVRLNMETAATCWWDKGYFFGNTHHFDYLIPQNIEQVARISYGGPWDSQEMSSEQPFLMTRFRRDGLVWLRPSTIPEAGKQMRLLGHGPFVELTSDSDYINLDPKRVAVIIQGAAAYLMAAESANGKGTDKDATQKVADRKQSAFMQGLAQYPMAYSPFQQNQYDGFEVG